MDTVYEQFAVAAQAAPTSGFLCYPATPDRNYLKNGAEFSYGDSLRRVDQLADRYEAAGFGPGHRVAILVGNRPEHFWHLLALNRIGASAVPLNPAYLDHELHFGIEFCDASLVVAESGRVADLRRICAAIHPVVPVFDIEQAAANMPAPCRPARTVAEAPRDREALIIYTSGTTGRPKGCMISNTSCLAAGESYGAAGGLIDFEIGREKLYIPLPAFHMNVSIYTLNTLTRLQNCMVLQDRFRASTWWQDIATTGATCLHYMGIIPPLLVKAAHSPWEERHRVKFGQGAGVDPAVREAFETRFGFPLIEAWGMTETSRAVQNCRLPRELEGRALGIPRPPLEARIVDEDDTTLPHGTPGELVVRASGPDPRHGFFSGYLKQPDETEKAWRNDWFHTGDIAMQREDGMLYFVDRKKNIIRRSGENIAAAEIEQVLIEDPHIQSVAVMAVEDELHDEEILAAVVLMHDVPASQETAFAICRQAESRLIRYKLPGWISFLDSLPVTGTQKVQKGLVFAESTDPRFDKRTIDTRSLKKRKDKTFG